MSLNEEYIKAEHFGAVAGCDLSGIWWLLSGFSHNFSKQDVRNFS